MPNWDYVLREIRKEKDDPVTGESAADKVRKKYLQQLHEHVNKRNIIGYYSGWLTKPKMQGVDINDDDKNGFMLCIHKLDRTKGLDLILHTPGGSGAATQSLVNYLRQMFGNDIRAFVPQIAMSAGTILACSCKEIWMGKHSNLGPVDPQVNGIPAYAVLEGIKMAYEDIKADPKKASVWNPILSRFHAAFVQQCAWAIQASKDLMGGFLKENMLSGLPDHEKNATADRIVRVLTEQNSSQGHDKHIHAQECKDMGLVVNMFEECGDKTLQDLVLTVHHCYMNTLANTLAFKIIENHLGRRFVKMQGTQQVMLQLPPVAQATPGKSV
jgi:ATP-dependent protease ClpP protease subunit